MFTLDQPRLSSMTNRYYADMMVNLCDENVYDKTLFASGYKTPRRGPTINAVSPSHVGGAALSGPYFYVVTATFADGSESVASMEKGGTASGSNNALTIVWSLVQNATGYNIYRTQTSGDYHWSFVANVTGGGSASYVDVGVLAQDQQPFSWPLVMRGNANPNPMTLISAVPQSTGGGLTPGRYYYVLSQQIPGADEFFSNEIAVDVVSPNDSVWLTYQGIYGVGSYTAYRSTVSGDYSNAVTISGMSGLSGGVQDDGVNWTGNRQLPPPVYPVQLFAAHGLGDFSLFAQGMPDQFGHYAIPVQLPYGRNEIYAQLPMPDPIRTASVFVNSYNFHLFFEMVSDEMKNYWQEYVEQAHADVHLGSVQDLFDSNTREASDDAFAKYWGTMTGLPKTYSINNTQYRAMVISLLRSYREATTLAGLVSVYNLFQSVAGSSQGIVQLNSPNVSGWRLGTALKFQTVRTPPNPTLTYTWTGANVAMFGKRHYIAPGTATMSGSGNAVVVYVDGTLDSNGYLAVQHVNITMGPNNIPSGVPTNAFVLAVVFVSGGDIVRIFGQGWVKDSSVAADDSVKLGPAFLPDTARLGYQGFWDTRVLVRMDNFLNTADSVLKDACLQAFKDVKPARDTVLVSMGNTIAYIPT